jgi:hypothetical protein
MKNEIYKILKLLDKQDRFVFFDDSLFNDLSIDIKLRKQLFNILDSKGYIETGGMGDPHTVLISDYGRNYLYSHIFDDNVKIESKTINISGNNNQVNQDSRNLENNLSIKTPKKNPEPQKQNIAIYKPILWLWKLISTNPLISAILATIIGTIILKYLHVI